MENISDNRINGTKKKKFKKIYIKHIEIKSISRNNVANCSDARSYLS